MAEGVRGPVLEGWAVVTASVVSPLHRYFSPAHLDDVAREMRQRGSPVLRAHRDLTSGAWFAMEGTHRLRAAFILGLEPVLVPISWWRTRSALHRARFAAAEYGYMFKSVRVAA
jgi:hypothetical protein